jgi:hypothetical protein
MTPPEDGNDKRGALGALGTPFGYHLERDAGVPVVCRPDRSTTPSA